MSVQQRNSLARLLKLLRTRTHTGAKGNTIKKTAPNTNSSPTEDMDDKTISGRASKNVEIPHQYYSPRPIPKTFHVGKVRKVSDNGSPPSSVKSQAGDISTSSCSDPECKRTPTAVKGNTEHHLPRRSPLPSSKDPKPSLPGTNSSTQQPGYRNANPVLSGVSAEKQRHTALNLLLGQQDGDSPYLTRRYCHLTDIAKSDGASGNGSDKLLHIPDLDPHAFDMYKFYTRTGKVVFRCPESMEAEYMWIAYWPLINAHILGCIIEESEFADRIMDMLTEKLTPGLCPDNESIQHLFASSRKCISDVLKQLIVDRFISAPVEARNQLNDSSLPSHFTHLTLETFLKRISPEYVPSVRSECAYHIHGVSEACYKTRVTPADVLKEKRLAEARAISTKDAQVVLDSVEQHQIKSVDWETRRIDANRALREETGRSWVGFRRLESEKIVERPKAAVQGSDSANSGVTKVLSTTSLQTNGVATTLDPTIEPNNSTMLQNQDFRAAPQHTNHLGRLVTLEDTKTYSSPSYIAPLGHDTNTSSPAELPDNTVYGVPHLMNLLSGYTQGLNRRPDTGGRTSQTLVVVGSMQDKPTANNELPNSECNAKVSVLAYDRGVDCPGAYPESGVGVWS